MQRSEYIYIYLYQIDTNVLSTIKRLNTLLAMQSPNQHERAGPNRPSGGPRRTPFQTTRLAALALLDIEVGSAVGGAVATVPVDSLDGVLAVAINGEVSVTAMSEETLLVDTEVDGASALGDSSGVRTSEADGSGILLHDVQVLPAGRCLVFGSVGDSAGVGGGVD